MKRIAVFLCVLLLLTGTVVAQSPAHEKLGAQLRLMVQGQLSKPLGQNVQLFVEGEHAAAYVASVGGVVNTDLGDLVTAELPFSAVLPLAEKAAVSRIRLGHRMRRLNDEAAKKVRADKVQSGDSPLPRAYRGQGVVIGIIDSGIDFEHPDFQNADGSTRLLSLWDQNESGTPPSGYSYGTEWSASEINSGACTHEDADGHGTHVSGSAAGNGTAIGAHQGMAPEADIIVVALDFSSSTGVIDGANYIFQQAAALGRPCVINASIGSHHGPHDGSSLESRMLDQMLEAAPGRVFCAAAGNEGGDHIHVTAPSDAEQYTLFSPLADGLIYLYLRVPKALSGTVEFAVGVDESDYNPFEEPPTGGQLNFIDMTSYYTADDIGSGQTDDFGADYGKVYLQTESISDSVMAVVITIEDDMTYDDATGEVEHLDLWRLFIKNGGPRVHGWIADMGGSYQGSVVGDGHTAADNDYSVGMPAVARHVFAVGASVNRAQWTSSDGYSYNYPGAVQHQIASFSSLGPTADGRLKPEFVAPGHGVISAFSAESFDAWFESDFVDGDQHVISSGTSMACPVAAGAIALYLEQQPTASYAEVLTHISQTAMRDSWTGSALPDNTWGWGKIDAFAMLSTSDVDEAQALPGTFSVAAAFPNPFNPSVTLQYTVPLSTVLDIVVYDVRGRIVHEYSEGMVSAGAGSLVLNGEAWPSGVYVVAVRAGSETRTQKMLLLK